MDKTFPDPIDFRQDCLLQSAPTCNSYARGYKYVAISYNSESSFISVKHFPLEHASFGIATFSVGEKALAGGYYVEDRIIFLNPLEPTFGKAI